eukprot:TRINITY_DN11162_c0_g1_i1.p1 TRINITY_DN11162_c0_g1~~TRINITY_DN11162_c0_g1_i1.p1  ORF type:complete len:263 (-),score=44.07 TRINITY_DN11162_c0_g1_i1:130-918(-)
MQLRNEVVKLIQQKNRLQNDNATLRRIIVGMNLDLEVAQNDIELDINQMQIQTKNQADVLLNYDIKDSSNDFNQNREQLQTDKCQILENNVGFSEIPNQVEVVQDDDQQFRFSKHNKTEDQLDAGAYGVNSKDVLHVNQGYGQGQMNGYVLGEMQGQIITYNRNNVQGNDQLQKYGQKYDQGLKQRYDKTQTEQERQICKINEEQVGLEKVREYGQFSNEVIDDVLDDFLVPVGDDDILNDTFDVKNTSQQYKEMMDILGEQ